MRQGDEASDVGRMLSFVPTTGPERTGLFEGGAGNLCVSVYKVDSPTAKDFISDGTTWSFVVLGSFAAG